MLSGVLCRQMACSDRLLVPSGFKRKRRKGPNGVARLSLNPFSRGMALLIYLLEVSTFYCTIRGELAQGIRCQLQLWLSDFESDFEF